MEMEIILSSAAGIKHWSVKHKLLQIHQYNAHIML